MQKRGGDSYLGGHTLWPASRSSTITGKSKSYTEQENAKNRTIGKLRQAVKRALREPRKTEGQLIVTPHEQASLTSKIVLKLDQFTDNQLMEFFGIRLNSVVNSKNNLIKVAALWNSDGFGKREFGVWTSEAVIFLSNRLRKVADGRLLKADNPLVLSLKRKIYKIRKFPRGTRKKRSK